jgi:hypothetical protein
MAPVNLSSRLLGFLGKCFPGGELFTQAIALFTLCRLLGFLLGPTSANTVRDTAWSHSLVIPQCQQCAYVPRCANGIHGFVHGLNSAYAKDGGDRV